jgi:RNA polymerase sigma-70 factor (ECF subfamily)
MLEHAISWTGAVETETQLIARGLRARDTALLHDLVERFQLRLVRYLVFFLGRRDQVDDLVQETWLRVVERGKSYDGRSPFQAWLFAIARNLAIDYLRRKKGVSLDSTDHTEKTAPAEFLTSAGPSPFELAARTEDAGNLAASLAKLEPIYREALLLRFQESLSLQEISITIGAPVPTVSSRIHRGLAMLRTQLQGESRAS